MLSYGVLFNKRHISFILVSIIKVILAYVVLLGSGVYYLIPAGILAINNTHTHARMHVHTHKHGEREREIE